MNTEVTRWTRDGQGLIITRQLDVDHSDVLVVDATTGAVRMQQSTGKAWASEVTADPSSRHLALALQDGTVRIIAADDGCMLAPPQQANAGDTFSVSISPDAATSP